MKTKLQNDEKQFFTSKSHVLNKRIYFNFFFTFIIFLFSSISFLNAQQNNNNSPNAIIENVVPNANATVNGGNSFLGPLGNSARTYQLLIAASELTNLIGKDLVSLSYRNLSSASAAWPTSDVTYNNYDIYLSGCVNPVDRSFTFANNAVGTQTQVRSGSLVIPTGSLSFGTTPNAFSFDINFTTPWNYAGGNLLVEIRHDGFSGTSRSVDAAGTSSSGYASLYSACWASSYTATSTTTQGNFAVINLKADDALGTNDFNNYDLTVFPNPTSESLFVESSVVINKISIINMLGQLVLEKEVNNQNYKLDLSTLYSGTYLLQTETDLGVSTKKIIKK